MQYLIEGTGPLPWEKEKSHHIICRGVVFVFLHNRAHGEKTMLVILYAHVSAGMDEMLFEINVVHFVPPDMCRSGR